MVVGLSKNVGQLGLPTKKNVNITMAKMPYSSKKPQNLDQKINYWKLHIWSQQKLSTKITHSTIQFHSENLIHFTNLQSLEIVANTLLQHRQKPYSLYKSSINLVSGKKHLHCTISKSLGPEFSKHVKSKCLYNHVYIRKSFLFHGRRKLSSGRGLNDFFKAAQNVLNFSF